MTDSNLGELLKGEGSLNLINSIRENEEAVAALENLGGVCVFLSLLFKYPDEEVYKAIQANLDNFKAFTDEYLDSPISLDAQKDMEVEYVRLFINDINGVKAVPYLSYYTNEDGVLCGPDYEVLKELMLSYGLGVCESAEMLEDHIAIVLEFVYLLFNNMARAEDGEEFAKHAQALDKVLSMFADVVAGEFTTRIKDNTELEFYGKASILLSSFFGELPDIINEVIAVAKN